MNNWAKGLFFWVILVAVLMIGYDLVQGNNTSQDSSRLAFSDFLNDVDQGQVADVTIRGRTIDGNYQSGGKFQTYSPEYPDLVGKLRASGVKINATPPDAGMNGFWGVLLSWFPAIFLLGVWIYFMRQMQSGSGKAMGFGKSKAKLLNENKTKVTFEDVAGIDEAKEELTEIVEFLKDPHKFQKLGGKIPKGCLLVGSPGTGKTLLARAIAGEANVPFFSISGSDFVEMFVGVGASRVRDMFEQGKKNAPCIIFIDEIDAVGRHRGAGLGGGNDEREQTLNQMLVEMDGFEANEGVIIIAATNRPDVLDPALLRPGRFDRQIVVPNPDLNGRERILEVHMRKVPLAPDVEPRIIARGTPGFSGADLANLVNEAALLAARRNKKVVTMTELENAKDKVMMGAERRSLIMSEEEKKLTAYHEAGHAIVALHSPASDPIHKATIIPRGRALGMVMRLPEADRLSMTRAKMHADLAVAMGGRVAEEIIFGHDRVTSGASSDIQYVTRLAKSMVMQWGMSEKVGPLFHGSEQEEVFLGHSMGRQSQSSNETAALIDSEVKRIANDAHEEARRIINKHLDQLHQLAKGLLEHETLSGDEIKDLLDGKPIIRANDNAPSDGSAPRSSSLPRGGKKAGGGDTPTKPKRKSPEKPQEA